LQNNDFELDERYFDAHMKQKLVQQLFKLKQGTEQNLRKLGAHPHLYNKLIQFLLQSKQAMILFSI
jgi:hypothetical protein